ncbi:MAG: hypothetical protein KDC73_06210 [Ignavibacteriae bacterium]|nr:hypothetical protein [Ignavibacteriota bacterium]MCB9243678.1 hypothetical protein [Ignavibacteriales bacterium]
MAEYYYILDWSKGDNWGSPDDPIFLAHIEYMKELNDKGKLKFGGPYEDGTGSLTVFDCTEEEIKAIMENDPALRNNIMKVSLKKMDIFYQ